MIMKMTVENKNKNLVAFKNMEIGQVFKNNNDRYYIKCNPNLSNGYTSNILNLTTMTTGKILDESQEYTLVNSELIIRED